MNINISGSNISTSTIGGKTKVCINGKEYIINSSNVSIINNKIYADGKLYTGDKDIEEVVTKDVIIYGNVGEVDCSGSLSVQGNVNSQIQCGGSISIEGSVKGNINCGGSAKIYGGQEGMINAGGSVRTYK